MCTTDGPYRCNGTDCGDGSNRFLGVCDKNGCDLNPARGGATTFYGGGGSGGSCNLQAGVNNMGTIMAAPTIQTDPVACCALCNATAGCAGFTFVASTSNCFLKSSLGNPIADAGATSGFVSPPATGGSIDTTQPFTVVTQFITSDGTDAGSLVEIRRLFVQNGVLIQHPNVTNINASTPMNSITDAYCKVKAAAYGDNDNFEAFGGLARMGEVMDGGMTIVLSSWVDYEAHMLWLDSLDPSNATAATPGVYRGPCAITSGNPDDVIANSPDATVTFSKISVGPIGFSKAALARAKAGK